MKTYRLTEEIRARLKHPLGELVAGPPDKTMRRLVEVIESEKPVKVFVVGDFVASNVAKQGVRVNAYVIDNRIMRSPIQPLSLMTESIIPVRNPPSTITPEAWRAIETATRSSSAVKVVVEGEEDLLTLPVIACAPEGSLVIYGQPSLGIVLVRVTQEMKTEVDRIMGGMMV
ncbi:MAG: GTP-dependent dephospho-CoA kinase family protein [Candidatus Bathyarchaeia archaeon]